MDDQPRRSVDWLIITLIVSFLIATAVSSLVWLSGYQPRSIERMLGTGSDDTVATLTTPIAAQRMFVDWVNDPQRVLTDQLAGWQSVQQQTEDWPLDRQYRICGVYFKSHALLAEYFFYVYQQEERTESQLPMTVSERDSYDAFIKCMGNQP